jgi:predicted lipoprotein with Yx(FWY)xxD motif
MRTSFTRVLAIAALAALALAACGSSSKSGSGSTATTPPTTAAAAETTTTTGSSSSGAATVALADNAKIGKKILVDDKGMTLYVYDKDTAGKAATCTGACEKAWPGEYVEGTPTYGDGLTASMFSIIKNSEGEDQLAVNGKPLYHWVNDKKAGDATGQDINSFYVVGADGNKIDEG